LDRSLAHQKDPEKVKDIWRTPFDGESFYLHVAMTFPSLSPSVYYLINNFSFYFSNNT
jgi:hypothetical protein